MEERSEATNACVFKVQRSPRGALGGPWGDLGSWAGLNWGQKGAKGEPEGGPDLMFV